MLYQPPQTYVMHDESDEGEGLPETSGEEDKEIMPRLAEVRSSSEQESSDTGLSETNEESSSE